MDIREIKEEFKSSANIPTVDIFFKVLYWGHLKSSQQDIHPHVHPYWQLEFILDGVIQVKIEHETYTLRAGDAILIPPMQRHTFLYLAGNARESWSLKFEFEGYALNAKPYAFQPENSLVYECIKAALKSVQELKIHYSEQIPFLNALLKVILFSVYPPGEIQYTSAPFMKKLRNLIDTLPYDKLKAKQLARECNYSPDHLSALVKDTTGLSLKMFINREIQTKAERLLAHSHFTIGEISDRLGFPNQYAFSHFFSHTAGMSPTAYRHSLGTSYTPEDYF